MSSDSAATGLLGVSNGLDCRVGAGFSLRPDFTSTCTVSSQYNLLSQDPPILGSIFALSLQPNESSLDLAHHMFLQIHCLCLELFLSFLKGFAP